MRTTIILKDELVNKAMEITDVKEKTALVHLGLEALIEKKTRERLIALAGSEKQLKDIPRRRR
jgi:Arc/MetJ family transcription regulator